MISALIIMPHTALPSALSLQMQIYTHTAQGRRHKAEFTAEACKKSIMCWVHLDTCLNPLSSVMLSSGFAFSEMYTWLHTDGWGPVTVNASSHIKYSYADTYSNILNFHESLFVIDAGMQIGVLGGKLSTTNWAICSCCKHLLSSFYLSYSVVCSTLALGAHQTKSDKSCSTPAESLIKMRLPSQSDTFYKLLTAQCSPLLPIQL